MKFVYIPKGVCSRQITVDVDDKGISELVKGMKAEDVIEKLENITCGMKPTSCPAQLAQALKENL